MLIGQRKIRRLMMNRQPRQRARGLRRFARSMHERSDVRDDDGGYNENQYAPEYAAQQTLFRSRRRFQGFYVGFHSVLRKPNRRLQARLSAIRIMLMRGVHRMSFGFELFRLPRFRH